eukprot:gene13924-29623_t
MDPNVPVLTLENYQQDGTLETDSNLQFFYGQTCPFTKKAEPHVQCLEKSLGRRIERLEVYQSRENHQKYVEAKGVENCGGVPYFYNKITGKTICGARDCAALIEWAMCTTPLKGS